MTKTKVENKHKTIPHTLRPAAYDTHAPHMFACTPLDHVYVHSISFLLFSVTQILRIRTETYLEAEIVALYAHIAVREPRNSRGEEAGEGEGEGEEVHSVLRMCSVWILGLPRKEGEMYVVSSRLLDRCLARFGVFK